MTSLDVVTNEAIYGRYIFHRKVGDGGMGAVNLVTDRLTQQQVALKQIKIDLRTLNWLTNRSEQSGIDYKVVLANEFQILSGLRHPHIISVRDFGFDHYNAPFYTMDYLKNAQTILQASQGLSLNEKIGLIQQMLEALIYLHRSHLFHRDLKPNNVLVTEGHVRLVDFGLASLKGQDVSRGGTLFYMPPEVLDTLNAVFVEATDLYSVGVMAYEMFAGEHPFDITSEQFVEQVLFTPPDLSKLPVGEEIAQVIGRLLAKKTEERFQTAEACQAAFNKALDKPVTQENEVIRESFLKAARFVGRQDEIKQFELYLKQAQENQSVAWLIGGESGVGKSRLLDEFRTRGLVAEWQVVDGQSTVEIRRPFQLWQQIVPRLILNTEVNDFEAGILAEYVPAISSLLNRPISPPPELTGALRQERFILTLLDLIRRQTRPTVILLEDLHWSSEGLIVVQKILKSLKQFSTIVLVGTFRNEESPHLPEKLPEAEHITLGRLSDLEIGELGRAILGPRHVTDKLLSLLKVESEGNTFFIVELMRALAERSGQLGNIEKIDLPERLFTTGIQNLLEQRIFRIPKEAQPLLQLAAIIGRQLDLQLMQQLRPKVDIEKWLQTLADGAILAIRDEMWMFDHDKLRETILINLQGEKRQRLHAEVANAMEQLYGEDDINNQILLEHWHRANIRERELYYLPLVLKYVLVYETNNSKAHELLERYLPDLSKNDSKNVELLNYYSDSLLLKGEKDKAKEVALQGQALSETFGDEEGVTGSLYRLANIAVQEGDYEQAIDLYTQCVVYFESNGNLYEVANCLNSIGIAYSQKGENDQNAIYNQRALDIWIQIDNQRGIAMSLNNLGLVHEMNLEFALAEEFYLKCIEIIKKLGAQRPLATTLLNLGNLKMKQEQYDETIAFLNKSLEIYRDVGYEYGISLALGNLAKVSFVEHKLDLALDYCQKSYEIRKRIGMKFGQGYSLMILGSIFARQGQLDRAKEYLRESRMIAKDIKSTFLMETAVVGFCWLAWAHEEFEKSAQLIASLPNYKVRPVVFPLVEILNSFFGSTTFESILENGEEVEVQAIIDHLLE